MAAKRIVAQALLILMPALLRLYLAAVYKVGDSAGWTTIGNIDYKQWAATKTFQVGDVIPGAGITVFWESNSKQPVFEYNAQLHNVMRVTHSMYRACNTSSPLATYTTGNDSVKITTKGHHFFFCGVPGHCQAGQKVDINVLRLPETAPASAPSGSTLSPPPLPSVSVPVSSPSNALTLKASKGNFAKLGLAITVLQFLYQVSP